MRKIRIMIILLVLLVLQGCGEKQYFLIPESNVQPVDTAKVSEDDLVEDFISTVDSQKPTEQAENEMTDSGTEEGSEKADNKPAQTEKNQKSSAISSQPVDKLSEGAVTKEEPQAQEPEVSQPETDVEKECEKESEVPADPKPKTAAPVNEPPQEPVFDIGYWISYARKTATGLGLELDTTAVDCWDNPITANPDCIYLERDITARLSRYAGDEDITGVWIWYESIGANRYLIYIGYA